MEYTTPVIAAREVSLKGVTEWVAANRSRIPRTIACNVR